MATSGGIEPPSMFDGGQPQQVLGKVSAAVGDVAWMPRSMPVGIPLPWLPHLGTALSPAWMECNGQTVSDPVSPLNGMTLPDLNSGSLFLIGSSGPSGVNVGANSTMLFASQLPATTLTAAVSGTSAGTPTGTVTEQPHTHGYQDTYLSNVTTAVLGGLYAAGSTTVNRPALSGTTTVGTADGVNVTGSRSYSTSGQAATSASTAASAAFVADQLATHTHTATVPLNPGTQTAIDNRPAAMTVRWVIRIK